MSQITREVEHEIEECPNEKTKSWKSWAKFRINAIKMCQILMGKTLEPFEKELFLFPRACRVCRLAKKEAMKDCLKCGSVTYCSEQHQDEHLKRHNATFCSELKYAMVCDNYESTVCIAAPPVPSGLDKEFKSLTKMEEHLKFKIQKDQVEVDLAEMEFRFLSERLAGPLSIVYAADKYGLANGVKIDEINELSVHIVGSNVMEMLGIIKWEYIAHR